MSEQPSKPKVLQNYTMKETASQLAVSRRWLADFVKEHPYYRLAGHRKLFEAADILRLQEAMTRPSAPIRFEPSQRSVRPTSGTARSTWEELQELLAEPPRKHPLRRY